MQPFSTTSIEEGLRATFPELRDLRVSGVLGEGFGSIVVDTSVGAVFRIGRTVEAASGYAKEVKLLPWLKGRLPLTVPEPKWYSGPSNWFQFGVLGYPRLAGVPLAFEHLPRLGERVSRQIAEFLLALHSIPVEEAEPLNLPGMQEERLRWEEMHRVVAPTLREMLGPREYLVVERWWDEILADDALRVYRPVVQHGDLWYENILVDEEGSGVVAVVDWERAALGDPAQDFATQMHLGPRFLESVLHAYLEAGGDLDPGLRYRLNRRLELRAFDGLYLALLADDAPEVSDAARKVTEALAWNTKDIET